MVCLTEEEETVGGLARGVCALLGVVDLGRHGLLDRLLLAVAVVCVVSVMSVLPVHTLVEVGRLRRVAGIGIGMVHIVEHAGQRGEGVGRDRILLYVRVTVDM